MSIQYQIIRQHKSGSKIVLRSYNQDSEKMARADIDNLNRREKNEQIEYVIELKQV